MREGKRGGGGEGLVHWRWGFDSEYVGLGGGSPLMQNSLGSGAGVDCAEEVDRERFLWRGQSY